jgi:hypothetical protein
LGPVIVAFKADPSVGAYVELPVDQKRGFWIDPLQVWLRIVDGQAACFNAAGRKILVGNELAEQAAEIAREKEDAVAQVAEIAREKQAAEARAKARDAKKDKELKALREEIRRLKGE